MIKLHRLNNEEFVLNAGMIEQVESTPDTVILLTNGKRLMVRDALDDVVRAVIAYKQLCHSAVQVVHQDREEINNG
jgi:flagellar protein FlbD